MTRFLPTYVATRHLTLPLPLPLTLPLPLARPLAPTPPLTLALALVLALVLILTPGAPGNAQDAAEEVVLGLSQDRVRITADFDGSEILIFGAVKRETAINAKPLDVIVTLSGPQQSLNIHRKDRRLGIWVNAETVRIHSAPSFYAVASSRSLQSILSETEDLRHSITIPRAIRAVGASETAKDPAAFTRALIRIREEDGAYQRLEGSVTVDQQTLFRTRIALPSNLTEGIYQTRVFLMRDREVVSRYDTTIDARKVGLERWIYALSREHPLLYGFLSLSIAIAAGWFASTAFRMLRSG